MHTILFSLKIPSRHKSAAWNNEKKSPSLKNPKSMNKQIVFVSKVECCMQDVSL